MGCLACVGRYVKPDQQLLCKITRKERGMDSHAPHTDTDRAALRQAVRLVAMLNLGYFGVEFAVALTIGSVSLFADSIDFLEDAAVNGLILVALGWSAHRRSMVGMILAAVLFAPAMATLWTAWQKLHLPVPPAPVPLSLAGLGALAIN